MILELQRFLLAAKEGNITRTAEKIFITQSALTQSLQRLEKELNLKLFERHGNQLLLTADGKALIIVGSKIMQLWNNAKNISNVQTQKPRYSIGMFDNAALSLSPLLRDTLNSKEFSLEVTIDNSTKIMHQLALGSIDVAVCVVGEKTKLSKHITLLQTFTEDLIPVSSKQFNARIKSIPFIFYNKNSHTREQTDAIFAKKNIVPNVFAESTSTTFMKELAVLGSGVALLPQNAIRSELSEKLLVKQRLPLKWKRLYGVYINTQSELNQNHQFIKKLLKVLQKNS